MSYYYDERQRDERQRRHAWDDDDWQPESERDRWQAQRRRQQMAPGQTSYGGPARPAGDYSEQYGAGRYPDRPGGREYESRYGSGSGYGSRDERYGGRDERYGSRADERYGRRAEGRYSSGSNLRYGLNGGYGWERAGEWRDPQAWQRDDDYAERQWRESAERAREPRESARSGEHDPSYSELRSDTRYWTEPGGDWDEDQRYGRHYSREGARRRGWEVDDRDDRDDERGDHGVLYNLGRRIGEAVGDLFGTSDDERELERARERERGYGHYHEPYHERERHAGPRGYQRSDDRIRDQICERLSYARGVDVSDVSVEVSSGVVTLAGTVPSRSQKYYIEDLADSTYGVTEVNNDIRVRREGTGMTGGTAATGSPGSTDVSGSTWRA
ncbi:BON domain-containing protein [Cupriavidus necator]|uniref:BON domain-containing protein n=1 Tax=Cupriavidus necator TaxID=106590 RepID=UPI0005B4CC3D|nr:BON domain-containing protein [Cupriavidus necator]